MRAVCKGKLTRSDCFTAQQSFNCEVLAAYGKRKTDSAANHLLRPGSPQGQATTLKRNGSDFSATILGALFRCGQITIWTDVDGVYSADPRKVGVHWGGWGSTLGGGCRMYC